MLKDLKKGRIMALLGAVVILAATASVFTEFGNWQSAAVGIGAGAGLMAGERLRQVRKAKQGKR
jgi:hypothetical protein